MDSEGDLNPEPKLTEFYLACKAGNAEAVKNFLDTCEGDKQRLREMILRREGHEKGTVLHCACAADNSEVVRILLNATKDDSDLLKELVLFEDKYKQTALHYACDNLATEAVKVLLETIKENSDLLNELILKEDKRQKTGLQIACAKGGAEVVGVMLNTVKEDKRLFKELLLKADGNDETLLHYGINKSPDVARTLLDIVENDRDLVEELILKETKDYRRTALYLACKRGYPETVRMLLDAVKKYKDIMRALLLKEDKDEFRALQYACISGDTEVAKAILDAVKEDSNLLEEVMLKPDDSGKATGKTTFKLAAENKRFDTLAAIFSEDYTHSLKTMEDLNDGTIHKVCDHGHKEAVLAILNAAKRCEKIDKKKYWGLLTRYISHQDNDGRTILHIICSRGDKALVVPVLEAMQHLKPANIFSGSPAPGIICLRDKTGQTAIHESCTLAKPDILQAMMEMALKEKKHCFDKYNIYAKKLLCATDNQGKTAFFQVFEDGDYIKLKIILRCAVMADCLGELLIQTENGQTIFHRAMKHGYNHTKCLDIVISQILSKDIQFADILDQKDDFGNTPFDYLSTAVNEITAVLMKLDKNGSIFHQFLMKEDGNKQTVLHRACIEGDSSTLNAIKSCIKARVNLGHYVRCDLAYFGPRSSIF